MLAAPALDLAQSLRDADRFHPAQHAGELMLTFFPESAGELALDLSNVTSMFYGLLLQVMGERFGAKEIDTMSREMFYRLGRLKARVTRERTQHRFTFYDDARDIVTILISAIYNASPEYEFCVERFDGERSEVSLTGVDRYYRAAGLLGLTQHLTWPALHPFFEGVNDELGLSCRVSSRLLSVSEGARLHTHYVFSR